MCFPSMERAIAMGQELHEAYMAAFPFPHIAIQGLWMPGDLDGVMEEFDAGGYTHSDSGVSMKYHDEGMIGVPKTQAALDIGNSDMMLAFLTHLTGIHPLEADPTFSGGGRHMHKRGGYLKLHTDFTHHPKTNKQRRVNMLLFLNKGWQEEWGGHLELWDTSLSNAVKVPPTWNMTVIFNTSLTSLHGHPTPIQCPEHETRKSLAWYYYSGDPKPGDHSQSQTRWRKRYAEEW